MRRVPPLLAVILAATACGRVFVNAPPNVELGDDAGSMGSWDGSADVTGTGEAGAKPLDTGDAASSGGDASQRAPNDATAPDGATAVCPGGTTDSNGSAPGGRCIATASVTDDEARYVLDEPSGDTFFDQGASHVTVRGFGTDEFVRYKLNEYDPRLGIVDSANSPFTGAVISGIFGPTGQTAVQRYARVTFSGTPRIVADFDKTWSVVAPAGVGDGSERTIAAWVYPRDLRRSQHVVSSARNEHGSAIGIDGAGKWSVLVGSTRWLATPAVASSTWTHVALSVGGGTARFYVNGALVDSHPYTDFASVEDTPYRLGAYGKTGTSPTDNSMSEAFDGLMSDARIFRRALSDGEIAALYKTDSEGVMGTTSRELDSVGGAPRHVLDLNGSGEGTLAVRVKNAQTQTIAGWVKLANTTDNQQIVSSDTFAYGIGVAVVAGVWHLMVNDAWIKTDVLADPGVWTHFVYVVTPSQVALYLNGDATPVATLTYAMGTREPWAMYRIGAFGLYGGAGIRGRMSDVRFWNRALNAPEVPKVFAERPTIDCDSGYFDTNGSAPGGTCAPILASCTLIKQAFPNAPSGTYLVDRDGTNGPTMASPEACDMGP